MARPLGLISPPSQKDRPVGLLLLDTGIPIGVPYLFYPRPEDLQYTHPSRGTVIQTMDGGFVDDFGEGLVDIIATGTTAQLVVDPSRVVALGADDVQAARRDHLLVPALPVRLDRGARGRVGVEGGTPAPRKDRADSVRSA